MKSPRLVAAILVFLSVVASGFQAPVAHAEMRGVAYSVKMLEYTYDPKTITVEVGSTVTWRNIGKEAHTATFAGVFDTGSVAPGAEADVTFDRAGTFRYFCRIHGGPTGEAMNGTVIVTEPSTPEGLPEPEAPAPTPPPEAQPPAPLTAPENATMPLAARISPHFLGLVGLAWCLILVGMSFRLVEGLYFI